MRKDKARPRGPRAGSREQGRGQPSADGSPHRLQRLEAGDFVPADARLLKSASLKSEESALTGESVPSEKDAAAVVAEDVLEAVPRAIAELLREA